MILIGSSIQYFFPKRQIPGLGKYANVKFDYMSWPTLSKQGADKEDTAMRNMSSAMCALLM